jgi:hypothetical protein
MCQNINRIISGFPSKMGTYPSEMAEIVPFKNIKPLSKQRSNMDGIK